jgi:hypothetical protein
MRVLWAAAVIALVACSSPPSTQTASSAPQPTPPARVGQDSTASTLVPAGFGTLRQEDISIILEGEGFRVAALPLDESVIRLLAPDSYRALRSILESKRQLIMQRASVRGIREPRVWQVRFSGMTPDARFVPTDVTVTSGGREYRPIDVIALTPGFGEQRLQVRETQTGLLVFEDGIDVTQPLVVAIGTARNFDWDSGPNGILKELDNERAIVRARAAGRP